MKRNLIYVFLCFGILIPSLVHSAPERGYKPGELQLITRLTTWILCKNHYRPTELDQKFSRTFFNEYLDTLDPMRIYFTAEDVKKFAIYQNKLGSSLLRGETDFGFELYSLYRKRLSEFIAFAEAECRKPQDFTADEYWSLKRDKSPRPATKEEQKNLWRLKIKNDLLYLRLVDRAMAEDKNKNKDKKQEAAAAAWKWGAVTPEKNLLRRLRDISNEVMKKDQIDILGIYLNSVAQVFGPHTNYFAPKLSEDFDISMSLSLTGIGATLTTDNGFIKVVNIVPGGPAAKDGNLKVEDRIAVAVQENMETTNLIDMPVSKAVRYIRGPEKSRLYLGILTDKKGNSPVSLNMISNALHYLSIITGIRDYSGIFPEWRGNIYFRVYPLLREKVELVDSGAKGEIKEVRLKNGIIRKIGVLELPSFYHDFEALRRGDKNAKRCSMDVARILMDFKKKKVDCVLMDLRFNGGGSLIEAIEMTGLFIPTGPVVQVRSSNKRTRVEYDEDAKVVYSGPLVILTSKLSASASEIFAAALKDCSRAILVGDSRTFGKGTILSVEEVSPHLRWLAKKVPAGSVTFETAMFYRTSGSSVQQLGIRPDIQLPSFTEEMKIGELFLDHHLPWDQIPPVIRNHFDTDIKRKVNILKTNSDERIKKSGDYQLLLKRIQNYRLHKNRKQISLNEAKRWKEYQTEKDLDEAAERLLSEDHELKKKAKEKDPVLVEAVSIAADYADILSK